MNYSLRLVVRDWTVRALLATSRALARAAAQVSGHPSDRRGRVAQRPELRVVRSFKLLDVDPVVEKWARMDVRDAR